jgi:hypothetical protein
MLKRWKLGERARLKPELTGSMREFQERTGSWVVSVDDGDQDAAQETAGGKASSALTNKA